MSLVKKYYFITALLSANFSIGVWALYFVERWGYSFTKAMTIFVTAFLVSVILDFFGGVHADVIGRKKSALIGIALEVVGCLIVALTGNYIILLISSLLWGVGIAMVSGSLDALVADELGTESDAFKKANSNVQMCLFLARMLASVVGGIAYSISKPLPYFMSGFTSVCALIVVSTLVDNHIKSPEHESRHLTLMKTSFRSFYKSEHGILFSFSMVLGIFAGDLIWTYYQPYYKSIGWSSVYLGLLFAGISLFSALGSRLSIRLLKNKTPKYVIGLNCAAVALNSVLLLFRMPLLSLIGVAAMAVTNGTAQPAARAFFGSLATKKNRATMLSLGSSFGSMGLIGGFLLAGILIDAKSGQRLLVYAATSALVGTLAMLFKRTKY